MRTDGPTLAELEAAADAAAREIRERLGEPSLCPEEIPATTAEATLMRVLSILHDGLLCFGVGLERVESSSVGKIREEQAWEAVGYAVYALELYVADLKVAIREDAGRELVRTVFSDEPYVAVPKGVISG